MPIFTVGAAGTTSSTAFDVTRGIRFADNAYQTRTPSSSSNRRTFTISVWVKLSEITTSTQYFIGGASSGNDYALLRYENFNFEWIAYNGSGNQTAYLRTNAQYKDPSAWYHIVIASDTTQATASNRTKMYVNGVQITSFQTENYPSQNADYNYNHNIPHTFGAFNDGASSQGGYMEGYMCEIVSIDGQQLTPSSFGEFESNSGIWQPIDPSGLTFGTNGFYLNFATKATDAVDASGNGNNFSSTNVVASDHSLDTCMNNYCTFMYTHPSVTNFTFEEGGLRISKSGAATLGLYGSSIMPSAGKWYWEVKFVADAGSDRTRAGVAAYETVTGTSTIQGSYSGFEFTCVTGGRFSITENGTTTEIDGFNGYATGDIIRFALDLDNTKLYIGRNGDWFNYNSSATGGDPTSGSGWVTNSSIALAGPVTIYAGHSVGASGSMQLDYNFGSPIFTISSSNSDGNGHGNFEYAVPSGYYALNSKNLAEFG